MRSPNGLSTFFSPAGLTTGTLWSIGWKPSRPCWRSDLSGVLSESISRSQCVAGSMLARLHLHAERARASLFFVPALFVAAAIAIAGAMLRVDVYLDQTSVRLPQFFQTTPESARSLLSTVASATITVAGVVFAITLVSIQLAASQFSPRVIPGFLRDSRQQRVMGLAVGTFAYCLVVLRAVRGSSEIGPVFIPHVSSGLSLALAIVTIIALVGFLDRSARTMQVGHIIHQLTEETTRRVRTLYPHRSGATATITLADTQCPSDGGSLLRAMASGWVCHIDTNALLGLIPPDGVMRVDVRNGSFVAEGQTIAVVWPGCEEVETLRGLVCNAIVLGDSRILLTDVAFGIRQLVDIGLRALSPGIHDPTTAYDVIVHLGIVLRELLWRDLTPSVRLMDDRRLVIATDLSHDDYVNRAFDQIRLAGASQSAIAAILMRTLGAMASDLNRDGLSGRAAALRQQGALALATFATGGPLQEDLERVRSLAAQHGFYATSRAAECEERV